jgi:hypothetical protein
MREKLARALRDLLARYAIRIYSVPRFKGKNPFVKISSWVKVMSFAEYFCWHSQ